MMDVSNEESIVMWAITEAHERSKLSRDELYRLCRRGILQYRTTGDRGGELVIRAASLVAYCSGEPQPPNHVESNMRPFRCRKGERKV
jgi:hypothetical protein